MLRFRRLLSGAALGMATLSMAAPSLAQQRPTTYGPHMWGGGWYGWIFGPIMMILVIAAVVAAIVLLVRWLGPQGHGPVTHPPSGRAPLDILKERFARGEIDKDEFEERRKVLGD